MLFLTAKSRHDILENGTIERLTFQSNSAVGFPIGVGRGTGVLPKVVFL